MIASVPRDTLLAALRAAGSGWTSARNLALAVYGFEGFDELHAVRVAVYRARQAGVPIETRPCKRFVTAGYRLADGEGAS